MKLYSFGFMFNGQILLWGLLLSQLSCSGDAFSVSKLAYTQSTSDSAVCVPSPVKLLTRLRSSHAPTMVFTMPMHGFVAPPSLSFPELKNLFSGFQVPAPQQEQAPVRENTCTQAADLSSALTLEIYFGHLQDSKKSGVLRFDEISAYSPVASLERFIIENELNVDTSEFQDCSDLYLAIVQELSSRIKGASSKKQHQSPETTRIHPLVEFAGMKPMPKEDEDKTFGELSEEMLKLYGSSEQHMHFQLAQELKSMGLEHRTDYTIHNSKIHLDIIITDKRVQGQVILQAHDEQSFRKGTREVHAYLGLKRRSLKNLGFTVVGVPYFEWDQLDTHMKRVAYLSGRLARLGVFGNNGEDGTIFKDMMARAKRASSVTAPAS